MSHGREKLLLPKPQTNLVPQHYPDRRTFDDLCRDHTVVPVWREIVADTLTPVAAFLRLQEIWRDDLFLLESVEGGERWARYSFLGGDAFATVKARDGITAVEGTPPVRPEEGETPLAYVRRLLASCRGPRVDGLPPLHGGAVGYLGYDCVRELENLPMPPADDLGLPDLALLLTRSFVVFDHLAQKAFVITNVQHREDDTGDSYRDALARCDAVVDALAHPGIAPGIEFTSGSVDVNEQTSDAEFERWVETGKEHVFAGDVFQVVTSRRFDVPLAGSAFNAYRALRSINPSPYMYFLRFAAGPDHPAFEVAGASPEPLVRVSGRDIVTRPIAGTRPRGTDEIADQQLEKDLLSDEKERAEHIMLVDLARNDVGRVAEYGTVEVDELMTIERYSHVMHLVSSVRGVLAADRSSFDALVACFPAGTVSGAPKVRAMEIIDGLEKSRRGPYAGVVGYFDFSGDLDTCITIRTIVATGGRAYVQAGAGIVADSVAHNEADETRGKAAALLRAVAMVTPSNE